MNFRFLLLAVMCVIAVFAVASEFHDNMESELDLEGSFVEVEVDADVADEDDPYGTMAKAWDKITVPVPAKGPTKPAMIPKSITDIPKFEASMPKWLRAQSTYEVPTMVDEPSKAEPTYV